MKRLLLVLAHPDDESLGFGGTIAKYTSEGAEVFLITATRGQRGRFGLQQERPSPEIVGQVRENELRAAAKILNIKEVLFLDYMDGDLDRTNPADVITTIAAHIRRIQPQIVLTFGPEGAYGHPDHIAISQFTSAAIIKAADSAFKTNGYDKHVVLKLYYMLWSNATVQLHQKALKEFSVMVDNVKRFIVPYPEWIITTSIHAYPHWRIVWQAISCHKTQMSIYANLENLNEEQHMKIWGAQTFYRVFSLVNGGRSQETDLFDGILDD